jgi:hypothetical protein
MDVRLSRYSDWLRAGRSGASFSARVQTGPGADPASCTMGAGFPGVKRPGRGVDHPTPSTAEINPFNAQRLIKTSHVEPFKH